MLHLHRSNRADGLVEALRALLAAPADDPFAHEVVAVPTRGMERWITQQLSARLGAADGLTDGVCANVEFPTPRRLVGAAVAAATGVEPETDPWLPERAVWPLLEVVDECLSEPWMQLLAAHLGGPAEHADPLKRARRFATVRHLAELFDGYALHRPDTVRAWAASEEAANERVAGAALALPAGAHRRAGARGAAGAGVSRCSRPSPSVVDLPPQVSIFGLTRLPAGYRDILESLAARRDLHLFLLHPSPALWDKVGDVSGAAARRAAGGPDRRASPPTACSPPGDATRARCRSSCRARSTPTTTTPSSSGPRRCWAASRPTCAPTRRRRRRRAGGRRPQHRDPRLPRPRAPGRGPARRDPAPPARRPDTRAARRHRHVPGHRDVRAADPRDLRRRRARRGRRADRRRGARPARPTGRPRGAPDEPRARRDRRAPRPRRRPRHGLAGAGPRRPRARPAALRPRRRGPRAPGGMGLRERHPLGPRRAAARGVQAGAGRAGHLGGGAAVASSSA